MTGLILPPDASLSQRSETQSVRSNLPINKLAALLPVPDVAQTLARSTGDTTGTAVQGRPTEGLSNANIGGALAPAASTRETLSFAARTILDLLDRAAESVPRAAGLLLPAPPTGKTVAMLPAALSKLVGQSGLFYESHLAAWLGGARSLAAVQSEPQALLGRPTQTADNASGAAPPPAGPLLLPGPVDKPAAAASPDTATPASAAASTLADVELAVAKPPTALSALSADKADAQPPSSGLSAFDEPAQARQEAMASSPAQTHRPQTVPPAPTAPLHAAQAYETIARAGELTHQTARAPSGLDREPGSQPANTGQNTPAVHPATEDLVRRQLELLATQQFRWIGEAWPGTRMAWEIAPRQVDEGETRAGVSAQAWSTRLLLQLPELGTVEARLSITPAGLEARLVTPKPAVAERFDEARAQLHGKLAASGIPLVQLTVSTGAPTTSRGAT